MDLQMAASLKAIKDQARRKEQLEERKRQGVGGLAGLSPRPLSATPSYATASSLGGDTPLGGRSVSGAGSKPVAVKVDRSRKAKFKPHGPGLRPVQPWEAWTYQRQLRLETAARTIQHAYGRYTDRQNQLAARIKRMRELARQRELAAIQIQRIARGVRARARVRRILEKRRLRLLARRNAAALVIQCAFRRWMARRLLKMLRRAHTIRCRLFFNLWRKGAPLSFCT